MYCPKCGEPINKHYHFCYNCGLRLDSVIEIPKEKLDKIQPVSMAEWSRFVLRALISYHERVTMGNHPDLDCWQRGLEFAVSCVEEKIK